MAKAMVGFARISHPTYAGANVSTYRWRSAWIAAETADRLV